MDPNSDSFDFTGRGFLNVDGVGLIGVGESEEATAQYNVAGGFLRFNESKYPGTSNLLVTHPNSDTWVVSNGATDVGALVKKVGKGKNATEQVTLYHMPFKITATRK